MVNKTYKINEGRVISETLEGETIIINLGTGNYYSTNITAAFIWNQIKENNNTLNILQYFLNHFKENEDVMEKSIEDIIDFLLTNELILESKTDISNNVMEESIDISKESFIIPKIEKYEDMTEMIFADPVHDVEEKDGWPNLR